MAISAKQSTLVIGGARSGKSRYAEQLVTSLPPPWIYVATAETRDDEMSTRVAEHRRRRGDRWQTVEVPLDLVDVLQSVSKSGAVLVDCLTLWLSNLMLAERDVDAEIRRLERIIAAHALSLVVVSNEVGSGIVPDNALARRFRDLQGRLNQQIAAQADRVVLIVAGLPMNLKGHP